MNNTELLNKLDTKVVECLKKLVSSENEVEKIHNLENLVMLFGYSTYELDNIGYALGMIEAYENELSPNARTIETQEKLIECVKEYQGFYDEQNGITIEAFKDVGIKWLESE